MNWIVLVRNDQDAFVDRHVVIGPFREESKADEWAEIVNEGYAGLSACVEWSYSPSPRDALREALDDLRQPEAVTP